MSHTSYKSAKTRLQRSELAVPGSSPKMFEKALNSDADYIFLDLEDAVSPNDKVSARENVIKALKELDWRGHGKTISVRINGLDTHYMYRDVVELMMQAGEFIDTILIPKVGVRDDVYMVDCMVTQIEQERELENKIGLECLIESALGMVNIEEIAQSSSRLEALHFGVADYAASLRARTVVIGGLNPDYPGDQWHHGLSKLVATCRAFGLRPIDGPFGDIQDPDGYIKAAKRGAEIIVVIDENAEPASQSVLSRHAEILNSHEEENAWTQILKNIKPKGVPFHNRNRKLPIALNHGMWTENAVLDAATELSLNSESPEISVNETKLHFTTKLH